MSKTSDIVAAMRTRYAAKEWALMFEVSNAAGFRRSRSADAVAMNLWPSHGLEIHGFEFKVSVSDFKNEMKQPEKAEAISQYCDRWFMVMPAGMVPVNQLPLPWGCLELKELLSEIEQVSPPIKAGEAA